MFSQILGLQVCYTVPHLCIARIESRALCTFDRLCTSSAHPTKMCLVRTVWSHAKHYEGTDRCSQPHCTASPTPTAAAESAQAPRFSCEFPGECSRNKDKTLGDSGEDWGWASRVVTGKGSQRSEGGHWLTVKVAGDPAPCCVGPSKQGQPEFTARIRPPTMSSLKQCPCHLPTV